jgi:predicted nucleic acid-binding protein
MLYLDSSAIVKLIQIEMESQALRDYLEEYETDSRVTSELARVEVPRAVRAGGSEALGRAHRQLLLIDQMAITVGLLDRAAGLTTTAPLRSLDAIHLAAALQLGPGLRSVVTYDHRMADAAGELDLAVASPS